MIRLPPRSTRTDTLFPYTTLFRSCRGMLLTALAVLAGCATPPHRADDAGHYRVIGYDMVRGNIRPDDVARIDTLIFAFAGLVDGENVLDPAQTARLHQGTAVKARQSRPNMSETRRVGKEGLSTGVVRWFQKHKKNNKREI